MFRLTLFMVILNVGLGFTNIPLTHPIQKLTPCQVSKFVEGIRDDFEKTIPTFNAELFAIQLRTDKDLIIRATNPALSHFLICYYTLASNTIKKLEQKNPRARNAMLLNFNTNYLTFLNTYGVPLTCVSFYTGNTFFSDVRLVQELAENLQRKFGRRIRGDGQGVSKHFALEGQVMIQKLGLVTLPYAASPPIVFSGSYNPICDTIFLKLQDGSILTNLPSVTVPPDTIKIPGEPSPINTDLANVTFLLSRYLSSGLNCLESSALRGNFSSSLCTWMSTKLLPNLLESSKCFQGFPGILSFVNSVQMYRDENIRRFYNEALDEMNRNVNSGTRNQGNQFGKDYIDNQFKSNPPPEFKNLYYGEVPSVDLETGEYAPLQGQQPEVIQNEIYKISPRFTYQLHESETTTHSTTNDDFPTAPLMAGVSVTAFLLLAFICCIIPLLYFYCGNTKSRQRQKDRIRAWFSNHIQLDEQVSSEESEPFIKDSQKDKKKCKTLVNIKLNETPIAELTIDDVESRSSDEDEENQMNSQFSKISDCEILTKKQFNDEYKSKRRKKQSSNQKKARTSHDYVSKRKEIVNKYINPHPPAPTSPLTWERRQKRHSLPLPKASDFRPQPRPTFGYERRRSIELRPIIEKSHVILVTSDDSLSSERLKGKRVELLRSEDQFYENNMVTWETDDNT